MAEKEPGGLKKIVERIKKAVKRERKAGEKKEIKAVAPPSERKPVTRVASAPEVVEADRAKISSVANRNPRFRAVLPDQPENLAPEVVEVLAKVARTPRTLNVEQKRRIFDESLDKLRSLEGDPSFTREFRTQAAETWSRLYNYEKVELGEAVLEIPPEAVEPSKIEEIAADEKARNKYDKDLSQVLGKIHDSLQVDPKNRNDVGWWADRKVEIEGLRTVKLDQRKEIINEIHKKIYWIRESRAHLPPTLHEKDFEEATRLQEEKVKARNELTAEKDRLAGDKNVKPHQLISDPVLRDLHDAVVDSGLSVDDLDRRIAETRELQKHLSGTDKQIAGLVERVLVSQRNQRFFAEQHRVDMTDGDIRYVFRYLPDFDLKTDVPFIMDTLGSPSQFISYLRSEPGGYEPVEGRIRELFNKIFREVDENPTNAFEDNYDIFRHKPVKDAFMGRLRRLSEQLENLPDRPEYYFETVTHNPQIPERFVREHRHIRDLVKDLHRQLKGEFEYREYVHNAFHAVRARVEFKAIAGFANKLTSEAIDLLLTRDVHVQSAVRLFYHVITNEFGFTEWEIDPQMFQTVAGKGEIISDRVAELMKLTFADVHGGRGLEPWEVKRAVSLARGTTFGVTTVALDLFGEASPPRGRIAWAGYIGDRFLYLWNIGTHFWKRWFNKFNKYNKAFYIPIREGGTLTGWDPQQAKDFETKFEFHRKTNLRQIDRKRNKAKYDAAVQPFIHITNLFDIAGAFGRGGWRHRDAIDHLIVGPRLGEVDLDLARFSLDDWFTTKQNLDRAGLNFLYMWATEELNPAARKALEAKIKVLTPEERAQWAARLEKSDVTVNDFWVTAEDVFRKYRDKDILFFVTHDNRPFTYYEGNDATHFIPGAFGNTMFGKALNLAKQQLRGEWTNLSHVLDKAFVPKSGDMREVRDHVPNILRVENDISVLSNLVIHMRADRFDDPSVLADFKQKLLFSLSKEMAGKNLTIQEIQSMAEDRLQNAKTVWEALQSVVNEYVITEFSDRLFPYGLGESTVDFRELIWTKTGQSTVARAFGDANKMLEDVVIPLLGLDELLSHLAATGNWEEIDKYLVQARKAIKEVNGLAPFYKFSYRLNTIFIRYLQKAWWGRLPAGLGSFLGLSKNVSLSHQNQGFLAKDMDEQKITARIQHLVTHDLLDENDPKTAPYFAKTLRAEVGGRYWQAGFDIARSVIPAIIGLGIVAGLGLGKKDTEEK